MRTLALSVGVGLLAATVVIATETEPAGGSYPGAINGQIAFQSARDGSGEDQVFVMGPEGQNPTNISNNEFVLDEHPSFSPDGGRIVLTGTTDSYRDKKPSEELYVVDADGTNRTRLTSTDSDESEGSFSPDGSRIVFEAFENGGYSGLDVINADGSGRESLLSGGEAGTYHSPKWSPDGNRIAVTQGGGNGGSAVCVVTVATKAIDCIAGGGSGDLAHSPDWSPDGSKLVFVMDPYIISGNKIQSDPDIWMMNADGSGQTRITIGKTADIQPVWSPDGARIAFTRLPRADDGVSDYGDVDSDIWTMNADGSGQVNLTQYPDSDSAPSWQPLAPGAVAQPPKFIGAVRVPTSLAVTRRSTPRIAAVKKVRFKLSKTASAKLALERRVRGVKVAVGRRTQCRPTRSSRVPRRKRCAAWKPQSWLVRTARRGSNSVALTGRIDRKALRSGVYRIRAGAVDSIANPARQRVSRKFKVVRR